MALLSLCLSSACMAAAKVDSSGLNPVPMSREVLAAASKAQEVPQSPILQQAWAHYMKWQGAWKPRHQKPTAAEREEIVALTTSLLAQLPQLAESEKLGSKSADPLRDEKMMVIGSPEFNAVRQTPGTQTLKALLLMGFAEHELDIAQGAQIAYPLLIKLIGRTPLDSDLYFLYARLSVDAQEPKAAWQAIRMGAYFRADLTDEDFDFIGFVGASVAKDQWDKIQKMLRYLAADDAQANKAIARVEPLYSEQAKFQVIPLQ